MSRQAIVGESIGGQALVWHSIEGHSIEGHSIDGRPIEGRSIHVEAIAIDTCMRGNRTQQYQATTCRHHGSFTSGPEELYRSLCGPSCLRRHDMLLWEGIPVRL